MNINYVLDMLIMIDLKVEKLFGVKALKILKREWKFDCG